MTVHEPQEFAMTSQLNYNRTASAAQGYGRKKLCDQRIEEKCQKDTCEVVFCEVMCYGIQKIKPASILFSNKKERPIKSCNKLLHDSIIQHSRKGKTKKTVSRSVASGAWKVYNR